MEDNTMKKFVSILMLIVVMIQFSAIAEIEPYGGYGTNDEFRDFVDNATITDTVFWCGHANQEMWFANGWHIIAECKGYNMEDVDKATEAVMHVYDDTHWIVDSYRITHDDEGTQKTWDIMYAIYTGELQ